MTTAFKRLFGAYLALFALGLCVGLPLLTRLILTCIDPKTHFYTVTGGLVTAANGFLLALTALLVLPVFLRSAGSGQGFMGAFSQPAAAGKSRAAGRILGVLALLTAAAVAAASVYEAASAAASGAGQFLTGLSGIAAAVFFALLAFRFFSGRGPDLRLPALLPVLWGVVGLISTFMRLTQVANISQYLYEVLQMVFAILFLYYHARLTGGLSNRRELNGAFAFGLPCAFYGFAATLPNYFARLADPSRGRLPAAADLPMLALSLYIAALLTTLLFVRPSPASVSAPAAPGAPGADAPEKGPDAEE